MLRLNGVPSSIDMVLNGIQPSVEPTWNELMKFLSAQGLNSTLLTLPLEKLSEADGALILRLRNPDLYVVAEHSPENGQLVVDLTDWRRLIPLAELKARWTGEVLEARQPPGFVFRPQRQNADAPALQFEQLFIDYGLVVTKDVVFFRFSVRNVGKKPLEFGDIFPDCGCITVDQPIPAIAPGQTGKIVARYDIRNARHPGPFQNNISVETNDPSYPYMMLTISGNNEPRIFIEPKRLELGAAPIGRKTRAELIVTFQGDDAATGEVTAVSCSDPRFVAAAQKVTDRVSVVQSLNIRDLTPIGFDENCCA